MKAFRKPSKLDAGRVESSIKTADEYILWTGSEKPNWRKASGRTACLRLVTEKRKPVSLAAWYGRAADAASKLTGFDSDFARGGLSLAQGAKPAVHFLLTKDAEGNFRAVKNIPFPDPSFSAKSIKAGDIVIAAEKKAIAAPK
jgi:hypothetical protein